ncbi:MAG: GNAT family N-acetyltransferase [Faecalibacterium sp.]
MREGCAMRHAGTQDIETPRLLLRRLLPEDAPQMYANWASDPEVTRYLRWEPHKSPAETLELLAAWATALPQPGLLPVGHGGKGHRTGVRLHQPVQFPAGRASAKD